VLIAFGCDSSGEKTEHDAIERTAEDGGRRVVFRVTPAAPVMGDRLVLTVTAVGESGVSADIGDFASRLAQRPFEYKLASSHAEPPQQQEDGRITWTWVHELDFFLPGKYELPAPEISFRGDTPTSGEGDDSSEARLRTEPITLTVATDAAGELGDEQLAQIPVADPVSMPREPFDWRKHWWIPALGVTVLALAAVLIRRWIKRRGLEPVVPSVPAHEWARARIASLLAEKLIERGLHQDFFYRLSAIIRGYVERRFGVAAPEMTTQEFLSAMSSDERFRNEHRDSLRHFLRECDMVKYACHQPAASEYDQATHSASDFVEETRDRVTELQGASSGAAEGGS